MSTLPHSCSGGRFAAWPGGGWGYSRWGLAQFSFYNTVDAKDGPSALMVLESDQARRFDDHQCSIARGHEWSSSCRRSQDAAKPFAMSKLANEVRGNSRGADRRGAPPPAYPDSACTSCSGCAESSAARHSGLQAAQYPKTEKTRKRPQGGRFHIFICLSFTPVWFSCDAPSSPRPTGPLQRAINSWAQEPQPRRRLNDQCRRRGKSWNPWLPAHCLTHQQMRSRSLQECREFRLHLYLALCTY